MNRRKKIKEKTYVCLVCGKKKKSGKKVKCCSREMVSEDKGNWNS